MTEPSRLERQYRWMLAWFPATHRQVYGEKMIGVLLASADDGQRQPRPTDPADLAFGGLRIRLRGLFRTAHPDQDWRDALAAFSVAAPVLMLFLEASQLYNVFAFGGASPTRRSRLKEQASWAPWSSS